MTTFVFGMVLGLALIIPVGVQSLFVFNQGLLVGFPRAFVGVAAVCFCDTFLIVLGAVGASALLALLGYHDFLIAAGSAYLVVMGLLALKARAPRSESVHLTRATRTVAQAVGGSALTSHSILDTVGVLGGAIFLHAADGLVLLAAGVGGGVVGVVLDARRGRLRFPEADDAFREAVDPTPFGGAHAGLRGRPDVRAGVSFGREPSTG